MNTIKFVEVLYTVGGSSVSVGGFVGLGGANNANNVGNANNVNGLAGSKTL